MLQICTKKMIALVASVAVILSFSSCESQLEDEYTELLKTSDSSELIQQKINTILEYNPQWTRDHIEVTDRHIVVDGDILYPRDSTFYNYFPVVETNNSLAARHYRQQYLVSSSNIMVNVMNIPDEWNDALMDAMDEWNNLDGGIYFYGQSSESIISGAINVHMGNLLNGFGDEVAGIYPVTSDGKPGSHLVIDNRYAGNQLSYSEKKTYYGSGAWTCYWFFTHGCCFGYRGLWRKLSLYGPFVGWQQSKISNEKGSKALERFQ